MFSLFFGTFFGTYLQNYMRIPKNMKTLCKIWKILISVKNIRNYMQGRSQEKKGGAGGANN
jgi:hypothetical protein